MVRWNRISIIIIDVGMLIIILLMLISWVYIFISFNSFIYINLEQDNIFSGNNVRWSNDFQAAGRHPTFVTV
jgi:hypothetical protein